MLDDGCSRCRNNHRRDRRDVENSDGVSPATDDVDGVRRDVERQSRGQNGVAKTDNFVHRLALDAQGDKKTGELSIRHITVHHRGHRGGRFGDRQRFATYEGVEEFGPGLGGHSPTLPRTPRGTLDTKLRKKVGNCPENRHGAPQVSP